MTKWSDYIRNLGTAGPPTLQGIYALGFALRSEIPSLAKYVRVDAAQGFTSGEKTQARANIGAVIGTDVQAYSPALGSIAGLTTVADRLPYATAANTYAVTTLTAFARSILDDTNAGAVRTTIGLGNVDNTSDLAKPISTATQSALDLKQDAAPLAFGQCCLTLSGGGLLLSRFNGRYLTINGIQQTIPSAGVTLAASGTVAGTSYYIYAYMSGTTMTLEASTTAPATDATSGMRVKTGHATRTLVGMARPVTGPAWVDSTSQRFVLSYFNRVKKRAAGSFTATRTTSSTSFVEINSEIRFEFLSWGDTELSFGANGLCYTNPLAGIQYSRITLDGATDWVAQQGQATAVDYTIPVTMTGSKTPTVGYHYATLAGRVTSGTGNWTGAPPAEAQTLIYGLIEG